MFKILHQPLDKAAGAIASSISNKRDSSPTKTKTRVAEPNLLPRCQLGVRAVLVFFSVRVLRGAPRALIQLALLCLTLVLTARLLPERVSEIAFGETYSAACRWSLSSLRAGADDDDDGSVGGGLRIVVFGSPDVASPVAIKDPQSQSVVQTGKSWTEYLCDELKCSSYLSFVSNSESVPVQSFTSTDRYKAEVRRFVDRDPSVYGTGLTYLPGPNYSFLLSDYPHDAALPDLAEQVNEFLSLPAPKRPPKETLWIFSLGTWDVWSLAALPRQEAAATVLDLIRHIFAQVEILYEFALIEESIAYSSFWEYHNVTDSARNRRNQTEAERVPPRENFRVLIPQLFDPSLTPGWYGLRPEPPRPLSITEQTRDAAFLTDMWNAHTQVTMDEWRRIGTDAAATDHQRVAGGVSQRRRRRDGQEGHRSREEDARRQHNDTYNDYYGLGTRTRRTSWGHGRGSGAAADGDDDPLPPATRRTLTGDVIEVPPPTRMGLHHDFPSFLMDAIVEGQMRLSAMADRNGLGDRPANASVRFAEVWEPCSRDFWPGGQAVEDYDDGDGEDEAGMGIDDGTDDMEENLPEELRMCDRPGDYLFHTPFNVAERARREIARRAAKMVRQELALGNGTDWTSLAGGHERT